MIVISYPKSGRTWFLRMLAEYLGYYYGNKHFSALAIQRIKSSQHKHDAIIPSNWVQGFHIISLSELKAIKECYSKKIIYLIRDPRDCLISLYFYRVYHKTGRLITLRRWLFINMMKKRFVTQTLRNWKKHVEDYHGFADETIRYEDLLDDCFGTMKTLINPKDPEKLKSVVEKNTFESVTGRKPGQEVKGDFARKGIIGDWRNNYDSPKYRAIIKEIVGDDLIQFGYEKDMNW